MLFVAFATLFSIASFALEVPANKIVDVSWLQKNINDPQLVVIMADYHDAYKKGHIPNSAAMGGGKDFSAKTKAKLPINLPTTPKFNVLAKKAGINTDSVVVFYGNGQDFKNQSAALELMVVAEYYGVKNSAVLDGGLAAWAKAGGEVTTQATPAKRGNFKAMPQSGVIATLEDVDALVASKGATFIDARGTAHFTGTDTDKRLGQHGTIPGALNIQAESLFEVKDGVAYFKSPEAIKALFANVDLKKPIVTYCNTGHLASGPWFAAKYLVGANDVKNYKGSMVEYSNSTPARTMVKGK